MKKEFFTFLLLLAILFSRGQYVTIPDTAFVSWLNSHGFAACLNGNQLDITCPTVLNDTVLKCDNVPIRDLTGVQYFKNLDTLNCANDSLLFIPPFPPSLKVLICGNNQLSVLPALPPTIKSLTCGYNAISRLPALPDSLTYLDCSNDSWLTILPALPLLLIALHCNYDNLDSLPALPGNLQFISCISNRLTSLPVLPERLNGLNCNSNHIAVLPTILPATMSQLWCADNNLSALPILPPKLLWLSCGYNRINELPAIPPTIIVLECNFNLLSSLPELPDTLDKLYFSYNPSITCLAPIKKIEALEFSHVGVECLPNYGEVASSIPPLDSFPLCTASNVNNCAVFTNQIELLGSNSKLKIYPNPSTNLLYINYSTQDAILKVSDMTGKIWTVQSNGNEIDTSSLQSGLYCLQVQTKSDVAFAMFVKE